MSGRGAVEGEGGRGLKGLSAKKRNKREIKGEPKYAPSVPPPGAGECAHLGAGGCAYAERSNTPHELCGPVARAGHEENTNVRVQCSRALCPGAFALRCKERVGCEEGGGGHSTTSVCGVASVELPCVVPYQRTLEECSRPHPIRLRPASCAKKKAINVLGFARSLFGANKSQNWCFVLYLNHHPFRKPQARGAYALKRRATFGKRRSGDKGSIQLLACILIEAR